MWKYASKWTVETCAEQRIAQNDPPLVVLERSSVFQSLCLRGAWVSQVPRGPVPVGPLDRLSIIPLRAERSVKRNANNTPVSGLAQLLLAMRVVPSWSTDALALALTSLVDVRAARMGRFQDCRDMVEVVLRMDPDMPTAQTLHKAVQEAAARRSEFTLCLVSLRTRQWYS